jgi:hypothetical protein
MHVAHQNSVALMDGEAIETMGVMDCDEEAYGSIVSA